MAIAEPAQKRNRPNQRMDERGENNSSDKQAMKSNKLRVPTTTATEMATAIRTTTTSRLTATAITTTNCVCHINYLLLNWQLFVVIYCVINCVYAPSICECMDWGCVCGYLCVNAGLCVFYSI